MMERFEMFDEIMSEVMEESRNCSAWYECFDGSLFEIVCGRISVRLGYEDCGEYEDFCDLLLNVSKDFCDWSGEMCDDL